MKGCLKLWEMWVFRNNLMDYLYVSFLTFFLLITCLSLVSPPFVNTIITFLNIPPKQAGGGKSQILQDYEWMDEYMTDRDSIIFTSFLCAWSLSVTPTSYLGNYQWVKFDLLYLFSDWLLKMQPVMDGKHFIRKLLNILKMCYFEINCVEQDIYQSFTKILKSKIIERLFAYLVFWVFSVHF